MMDRFVEVDVTREGIARSDGSRFEVKSAEIVGPFAITRTIEGDSYFRFTLTHIMTGRAATRADSIGALRDLAQRLNARWPHPAFAVAEATENGAREYVQEWQRIERDGGKA